MMTPNIAMNKISFWLFGYYGDVSRYVESIIL